MTIGFWLSNVFTYKKIDGTIISTAKACKKNNAVYKE